MGKRDGLLVRKLMDEACSAIVVWVLSFQPLVRGSRISFLPRTSFTEAAPLQNASISLGSIGICRLRDCSRVRTVDVISDMSRWDLCR